jgi:cobalamin biosynthesis protein CbiG
VDSLGLNAISVLSGHIGGANDLAREVAAIIGAREVITTQSDNAGLWALDTFEKRFDWTTTSDEKELQECIYAFVNRKPTALFLEIRDEGTDYLEKTKPEHVTIIDDISEADPEKYELLIMVTPFVHAEPDDMWVLHFVPMVGTIGFGLAHHPKVFRYIYDEMAEELIDHGILPCSHRYCTIDAKKDEPFCRRLEKTY